MGPRLSRGRRRHVSAPHGGPGNPRRPSARRHRGGLPDHDPRARAAPHSRRGPVRPARWDACGCGSTTGKTGGSTGRGGTAIRSASLETTWSARSCRSTVPAHGPPAGAKAVWLEPPADMGRPVWRDVLEHTQLGPEERAGYLASARFRRAALAAALGPDRGQGGRPAALERRRPSRRFIQPIWRSWPTNTAGPC